jgi:hypothetical protein
VANRVPPVLRDPRARRASPDREALYATSKGPEMLSRAAMAKCLHRPFARKVLLRFKERPGPNVAQQPAWLGFACESRLCLPRGAAASKSLGRNWDVRLGRGFLCSCVPVLGARTYLNALRFPQRGAYNIQQVWHFCKGLSRRPSHTTPTLNEYSHFARVRLTIARTRSGGQPARAKKKRYSRAENATKLVLRDRRDLKEWQSSAA